MTDDFEDHGMNCLFTFTALDARGNVIDGEAGSAQAVPYFHEHAECRLSVSFEFKFQYYSGRILHFSASPLLEFRSSLEHHEVNCKL